MTRKIFFLFALVGAPGVFAAGDANQIDGNPALFSVTAALDTVNAAGGPALLGSTTLPQLRQLLRNRIKPAQLEVMSELRNFVISHKKPTPEQDLGQYISFALSVTGPPEFTIRFKTGEVPPDVDALEGFQKLMVRFHQEARIDDLWNEVQPALDREIARYHEPITQAVLQANGYLRNPTSGYLGRRFLIYIDLLGPINQLPSRSYGDDYFMVVPPTPQPQVDEIRHGYLHYLLDPLSIKYSDILDSKKPLLGYAQLAPVLDDSFKSDFLLLATESLIKAIEARLEHATAQRRQEMVNEALAEGFVLTPFFADQLPLYEKQEAAMRMYYPDMMAAIDVHKEAKRLQGVQFASERRPGKVIIEAHKSELSDAQKQLQKAEDLLYNVHDLANARLAYLKVTEQTQEKSLHARAYYGLGRIAALQRDPELAQSMFTKTLELGPDPQTRAWAEVYLGRLSDLAGEREDAAKHYQAALAVNGASDAARKAAEQGLKAGFAPKRN